MTILFKQLGNLGRLGNILFQCAATIGTAIKYGDNYRFPYLSVLHNFNIPNWSLGGSEDHHVLTYNEPFFHYQEIPRLGKTSMNLHGYFQSEKYFEHCKEEIKKILTPKYIGNYSDFTSIHVRRTDYLTHVDCYNILTLENYYEKAMSICNSDRYLVFSDDIEWCKKHFIGNQFDFSEERDPVKDLGNIIGCSNHIVANSSFSWWGSWLSNNKNKKVIVPQKWFGPKLIPTHNTKDLIPSGWIKV